VNIGHAPSGGYPKVILPTPTLRTHPIPVDPLKAEYLRRLGIVRFVPRSSTVPAPEETDTPPRTTERAGEQGHRQLTAPPDITTTITASGATTRGSHLAPAPVTPGPDESTLAALARTVAGCAACDLHRGRSCTVFGSGSSSARWMVVGEGPGAEEDRQGLPFVGRAGQLLTAMLEAIGVAREAVYIANTVKCRPPQNRDPTPAEMAACRPFLDQQVAAVDPALILAVGRIAAQSLLGTSIPLARLRGQVHQYPGRSLPLIVTYHPAYLLRSPREKRKAWEDLLYARSQIPP